MGLNDIEKSWMTAKEVASYLHVTPETVYDMAADGTLASYTINARTIRFNPDDVRGLPKQRTVKKK